MPWRCAEYWSQHKGGNWRSLESVHSWIFDQRGKLQRAAIVSRDITDRKRLKEQLRQLHRQGGVNLATSQCNNSRARERHGGIRASSRVFQRTQSACSTLSRLLCEKLAGYQIASTAPLRSRLGMRSQRRPQRRERVRYFMLCGASRADMDGSCITSPLQSRSTNPWHRLVGRLPPATS